MIRKKVILPKQHRSLLMIAAGMASVCVDMKCMLCRRRLADEFKTDFLKILYSHMAGHFAAAEQELLALGSMVTIASGPMSSMVEQVFGFRPATSQATEFWQQHPPDLSNGPLWEKVAK